MWAPKYNSRGTPLSDYRTFLISLTLTDPFYIKNQQRACSDIFQRSFFMQSTGLIVIEEKETEFKWMDLWMFVLDELGDTDSCSMRMTSVENESSGGEG